MRDHVRRDREVVVGREQRCNHLDSERDGCSHLDSECDIKKLFILTLPFSWNLYWK